MPALLRNPVVQQAVRAAVAAGLAWQLALLLPAPLSDYAYYAPLGAIIAVHPTVADSASATWRTVLAIVLGSGLAVAVFWATQPLPRALTLALVVVLAVLLEQWRVLGENASWVPVAAVFMLLLGAGDPLDYAVAYAGLVLFGAALGVLLTYVFPPLQLTRATGEIAGTRGLVARRLERTATELRTGRTPTLDEEQRAGAELGTALDRMRDAERTVERARRANPRERRWRRSADRVREESRALDRVAVLLDDVTTLVAEYEPHRRGGEQPDLGTAARLADALDGLAGVVRTPYHDEGGVRPDGRDHSVQVASEALDALVDRLRRTTVDDDPGYLALCAVAVGIQRALLALDAQRDQPAPEQA
ncbi:aromatic acid exporter family protein [Geodermatophilus marinus]|uniref:aromatic acid exporter family protein n=1 Tax=Geodermatophilus sp. LHW52908 TaxID=2303986 RepID=UPI0013146F49|nr:aromatic acid exporter family protein [Geodermatophilus sp. LHW52908]